MQQPMQHQLMGYDRAITMFSPDGRLLQVEYARKTVKQGSTTLGMVCSDGVFVLADKKIIDPLIVPSSVEKVFQIDDHIVTSAAGIISDARVLVERSQIKAQQHRVAYDTDIDSTFPGSTYYGIDVNGILEKLANQLSGYTVPLFGFQPNGFGKVGHVPV